MPYRVCLEPRCPEIAIRRGRCPEHNRLNNRVTRSSNQAIYKSKRWQLTRDKQLFEHPLCAECGEVATDVHHKRDIGDGGDPWDFANLQSLCHACHSTITRSRL